MTPSACCSSAAYPEASWPPDRSQNRTSSSPTSCRGCGAHHQPDMASVPSNSCVTSGQTSSNRKVQPSRTLDPGLAREGIALFRSLPATADRDVLLCTDLHAENVLAAQRQSWLVIDPKPYVGDPTYDPLQHLLNCPERLQADPRGLTTRIADLLELDRDRLLAWLFARCVQESLDWPHLADIARRIVPG